MTDVSQRIAENNPWYIDDQFATQMKSPAMRASVLRNWVIFEALLTSWAKKHPDKQFWRILDSGCGDGLNLSALCQIGKKLGKTVSLFGCDYNGLRLQRAQSAARLDGAFQGTLLALPVATNSVDVILCNHVLEHIREDDAALRELHRILAPDGVMVLGVPNEGCTLAQLRNNVLQPIILKTTDHVQFYTRAILARRIAAAGFDIQSFETIGFFLPHLRLFNMAARWASGRAILHILRKLFPSQAAGLVVAATKRTTASEP